MNSASNSSSGDGVPKYSYPPTYKISPQVTWTPVTEHGVHYSIPPIVTSPSNSSLPPASKFNSQLYSSGSSAASVEAALEPQISKSILIDSALPLTDKPQVNHTLLMDSALPSVESQVNHTLLVDSVLPSEPSYVDTTLLIESALPTNEPPNAGTTLLLEAMQDLDD